MTLKKKIAVSTLAVSMTAASLAGIPLSGKGLAEKLGIVSVASAAVSNSDVKTKINNVYSKLNQKDVENLFKFKTAVTSVVYDTYGEFEKIIAPIQPKLKLNEADMDTARSLFTSVTGVVYDVYGGNYETIRDIRTNEKYADLVKRIGVQGGVDNLTVDDFKEFVFGTNGLEAELRTILNSKSEAELLRILNNPAERDALFESTFNNILAKKDGAQALRVSQALSGLGITASELKQVAVNFKNAVPESRNAALSLITAYLTAYPRNTGGGDGGSGGGGGGTVVTTPANPIVSADGVLDVSKLVVITGDKAVLRISDATVLAAMDKLIADAKAANKDLKNLTLTLNLGTVNAKTIEVPLSKAIIEAAKAKGIKNIAIAFNGVTVTLPVANFDGAVTLTTTVVDDSTVTKLTTNKLASSVYDFTITVDGKAVTTFKEPVTLRLPLKNTTGLDKELLSVAKVVYGALQYQGGVLDGEFIVEPRDTFSSYAVVENKVSFSDTAKVEAWAGRQIQVVAAKGAIEGVGQGKFAPKNNVTRAEFAKMLVRALNLESSTAKQSFADVSSSAWYAPYVAVAAEKGIINGRGANRFEPNATITRAEMATMISRALQAVNKTTAAVDVASLSKFADAGKINPTLRDGVAFAATNNLVIGNGGKFFPNNTANRAEAAVIIYRTMNLK